MRYGATADHIQLDVEQTFVEIVPVFDEGRVKGISPDGVCSVLAAVIGSTELPGDLSHQPADLPFVVRLQQEVYMIRRDRVVEEADPKLPKSIPQFTTIGVPIFGELQQIRLVVASVRNMKNASANVESIKPSHESSLPALNPVKREVFWPAKSRLSSDFHSLSLATS